MTRLIIIVTAYRALRANLAAAQIDTEGGSQTFTVPLSYSGNLPATHFWCSWQLTEENAEQLKALLAAVSSRGVRVFENQEPDAVLEQVNLQRIIPPMPAPLPTD